MLATGLRVLLRGAVHRRGSSVALLIVALVASAAAAIGPAYYASSKTSILRDTLAAAPASSRGIELSDQVGLDGALQTLSAQTQPVFDRLVPAGVRKRVFQAPIDALEATAVYGRGHSAPLVWRTDVCAHLHFRSGQCSTKAGQVAVSRSFASTMGVTVGHRFASPGWGELTIVGIYDTPDANKPYWFGRGGTYFANEEIANVAAGPKGPDAMFTPRSTIAAGTGEPQGTVVIDRLVNPDAVRSGDLTYLVRAAAGLNAYFAEPSGSLPGAQSLTDLLSLADNVHASWRSLEISIALITIQLLVLVWLVMYSVIGDAIGARGPEIALMKLRGRRRVGLLTFALGESIALLAVALPVGVGLGALAAARLDSALLRAGTPSTLPWTSWAAAAVATIGGVVAALVAARRTLIRSVIDQWSHANHEATRRGWLVDGIVVTAAVAGIIELVVGGEISSVKKGSLGLLVPGLIGLAIAVVASRLLPWLCRRAFGLTRRRDGLGAFLAVRQIARRSAGARTTVVLATAFALATFALAAWATGQHNRQVAANIVVGAPTVLTLAPAPSAKLEQAVEKVDPGGTRAALVDYYFPANGAPTLLAVDPARFSHVAAWSSSFAPVSLSNLMGRLTPPVAQPVDLTGDLIRVHLDLNGLKPTGLLISATVRVPGADGPVYVNLGTITRASGPVTFTAELPGCPCQLQTLDLSAAASSIGTSYHGTVLLAGIETHNSGGWTPLTGLADPSRWRTLTDGGIPETSTHLSVSAGMLRWPLNVSSLNVASLAVADVPVNLPAVASRQLDAHAGATILGLSGNGLKINPLANASAVPGAPGGGVIVDRTYAERQASDSLSGLVDQQVWVAAGAGDQIEAGLRADGVKILAVQRAATQARLYDRQGPGLAGTVFLIDALAAALLAAGAALTTLATAANRRRFEYAALGVVGASRRSLYSGLLIEQLVVLLFGAVAGTAAGIGAALLALRNVPEFVTAPAAVPLTYGLPGVPLAVFLGAAFAALVVLAIGTSAGLLAGASPNRLREIQE